VAACQRAIRLKPNFAEAYYNLAIALAAQKYFDHALAGYRKAVEIRPDYAEAHSALGTALQARGKLDDAIAAYQQAITLKPDYAEAHCNLGRALHDQGKSEEAIGALRHGLLLDGSSAEAHNSLGLVLRAVGKLSEGRAALVEAIRLAPLSAKYRRHLSEMIRFRIGDSHLTEMERLPMTTLAGMQKQPNDGYRAMPSNAARSHTTQRRWMRDSSVSGTYLLKIGSRFGKASDTLRRFLSLSSGCRGRGRRWSNRSLRAIPRSSAVAK
jgi:tetratricopeptide (TPR) repeat protein